MARPYESDSQGESRQAVEVSLQSDMAEPTRETTPSTPNGMNPREGRSYDESAQEVNPTVASYAADRATDAAYRRRNGIIFCIVVAAWLLLDLITKAYFDTYEVGDLVASNVLVLFDLRLVHNTGAAWGLFGDSTLLLGLLSIAVCVLLIVYLFFISPRSNIGVTIGLSLVVAGGIGNAIDRFAQGYVIDFIQTNFMDFPVFNVADIGVTCGFILFFISLIVGWSSNSSDREGQ